MLLCAGATAALAADLGAGSQTAVQTRAAGPATPELRVREAALKAGHAPAMVIVEARRAYVGFGAALGGEREAEPLARRLFDALPASVVRLWLSWPGARGGDARLFERSFPARALAAAIIERLGDEPVRRVRITAEHAPASGAADRAAACPWPEEMTVSVQQLPALAAKASPGGRTREDAPARFTLRSACD